MSTILLGIDGTGPTLDRDYRPAFRNSFVNYIVRHSPARFKQYLRGPGWDGVDMGAISGQGYTFVHLNKVAHPEANVILCGYSRGAAGVIDVARRLHSDGVQVSGLMLFDAVDRSITSSGTDVTNNVLRMVQVRRDPGSFSRWTFQNCAESWHAPTRCERSFFYGTHGAMGGTPWPTPAGVSESTIIEEGFPEPTPTMVTYRRDAQAAREVWSWVRPRLQSMGFIGG